MTYIVDSTKIKGRPMREVFPEVEECMLENYDPDAPSLAEKFGMFQLAGPEP